MRLNVPRSGWLAAMVLACVGLTTDVAAQPKPSRARVEVSFTPGYAKVRVRRKWTNQGNATILSDTLHIADGGVMTEARVRAHRHAWMPMGVFAPADANRRFQGDGREGGFAAKIDMTGSPSLASFNAYPFPAGHTHAIDYTMWLPLSYTRGAFHLVNPKHDEAWDLKGADVTIRGSAGRVTSDDGDTAPGAAHLAKNLAWVPHAQSRGPVSGGLAFVTLGEKRRALRFRIEAAAKLSLPPKNARVVLILDASRSLSSTAAASNVAAARAYLSHIPDARVEILTFDRSVHSVFGKLVDAAKADRALSQMVLQRRNGSEVQRALSVAKARLGTRSKGGPKRVVVFTDAKTRSDLRADDLGLGDSGALVHVAVNAKTFQQELSPSQGHSWEAAVRATGGLMWRGPKSHLSAEARRRSYEQLVRPLRIRNLGLSMPAAPSLEIVNGQLREGEGLTGLAIAEDLDPRVTLTGTLWTKPVELTLDPSVAETRRWEQLLLASPLASALTEPEAAALAKRAGVLSVHTSFVATTPGRRNLRGGFHGGNFRSSSTCRARFGNGHLNVRPLDPAMLTEDVHEAADQCGIGTDTSSVEIETTDNEIVAVRVSDATLTAAACLRAKVWDILLPYPFGAGEHATYRFDLGRR